MAIAYSAEFLELWSAYPPRNGRRDKKAEAFREYVKLSPGPELHRQLLIAANALAGTTELPPDLCRFLKHRRWEDEVGAKRRPAKVASAPARRPAPPPPPPADDPLTEEDRRAIREHLSKSTSTMPTSLRSAFESFGDKVIGDGDDPPSRKTCSRSPDMVGAEVDV